MSFTGQFPRDIRKSTLLSIKRTHHADWPKCVENPYSEIFGYILEGNEAEDSQFRLYMKSAMSKTLTTGVRNAVRRKHEFGDFRLAIFLKSTNIRRTTQSKREDSGI